MTGIVEAGERDLALVAAALLEQGWKPDALSRLLTGTALGALLLLPALGSASLPLLAVIGAIALAGLVETYLAIRVGFDAALFRALATAPRSADLDDLDAALLRTGLMKRAKAGRAIIERIGGARRLLKWQAWMLGTQAALTVFGASLALLYGGSGR